MRMTVRAIPLARQRRAEVTTLWRRHAGRAQDRLQRGGKSFADLRDHRQVTGGNTTVSPAGDRRGIERSHVDARGIDVTCECTVDGDDHHHSVCRQGAQHSPPDLSLGGSQRIGIVEDQHHGRGPSREAQQRSSGCDRAFGN